MLKEIPIFKNNAEEVKKELSAKNKKILRDFLDECALTTKDGTKMRNIERHILRFYLIAGKKDFDKWTKEDIIAIGILLKNYDKSIHTANEMIVYFKKFVRKLFRQNLDILEVLEKIRGGNKRIDDTKINENNFVTAEELEKMLRHAESFRQKALLLVLWETGCRPQEILELKWRDIKFDDSEITNINFYSKKTNNTRTYPVKEATIHLKRWRQEYCFPKVSPEDYVFPNRNNRQSPITSAGLNKFLRITAEKAGIQRKIWAYLFRHSRATALYENLPQQITEKLMGHKNMAGIYAHISAKKARDELINKVYHIEELSPDKRAKLEKEIEELKKNNNKFEKALRIIYAQIQNAKASKGKTLTIGKDKMKLGASIEELELPEIEE